MKRLIVISFVVTLTIIYSLWQADLISEESEISSSLFIATPCANPDSTALMALFNATNGPGWSKNTYWGDTCDICLWYGITCNNRGRVHALQLYLNKLQGTIPPEIENLSELEFFDVSGNQLSGSFPTEIASLQKLKVLNLGNNQFSGPIPGEIGQLSTLTRLKMRVNNFNGSLPSEIGNLNSLIEISLEYNQLSGSLPGQIGNLKNLESLFLFNNQFVGTIPPEIGNLTTLSILSLSSNSFSGEIPIELSSLANLRYLDLSVNQLTDELPMELGMLFQNNTSNYFSVASNNLEGCIPQTFQNFCVNNVDFKFFSNPCLWVGTFENFCAGSTCSFYDYTLSATPGTTICRGSTLDLNTTNGIAFVWSTGETGSSVTVSPISDTWYHLTLTTTSGCIRQDSIFIAVSEPPVVTVTGMDVSSFGGADGAATAAVSNGESPYYFEWSTGSTNQMITDLVAGQYYVTVYDANSCQDSASLFINEPLCAADGTPCDDDDPSTYDDQEDGACGCAGTPCPLIVPNLIRINSTCSAANNGSAMVDPTGGSPPYSVSWSTGETGGNIDGLAPGIYSVTIADATGCATATSFTVVEPTLLSAAIEKVDESLPGAMDGIADLTVNGGTSPYTFYWNTGATTEDIITLSGDGATYLVTISDANGCQTFTETTILTGCFPAGSTCDDHNANTYQDAEDGSCNCTGIPCPVIHTNLSAINLSCNGADDGSVRVAPSGGTEPYSILWSTGHKTKVIDQIEPGAYSVTVTDANGCQTVSSAQVKEPLLLDIELMDLSESVVGAVDGEIDVFVSGGSFPYLYFWSNGATTRQITGLTGDSTVYRVTVTDSRGCSVADSVYLQSGCADAGVACDDGNQQTFQDQEDGSCGCVGIPCTSFSLNEVILPMFCADNNGSISLSPTGGLAPYTYLWSNGNTDSFNTNLISKIYIVTVTDANGCQEVGYYEVPAVPRMQLDAVVHPETFLGASDGAINLSILGGHPPYLYSWSNGADTEDLDHLPGDSLVYQVLVEDQNGCRDSLALVVRTQCSQLGASCDDGNPNTYNDRIDSSCTCVGNPCEEEINVFIQIKHVSCFGFSDGMAWVDTMDQEIEKITWDDGSDKLIITDLNAGSHFLKLHTLGGCQQMLTFIVEQPEPLEVSLHGIDATIADPSKGAAFVEIAGGTAPYRINWSTGDTTTSIQSLDADQYYSVRVADMHNCEIFDSIFIAEFNCAGLSLASFEVMVNKSNACISTSQIRIIASPETPENLLFSIDQGRTFQESPEFIDLPAGAYYPSVLDDRLGCLIALEPIILEDPSAFELIAFDPSGCFTNDARLVSNNSQLELAFDTLGSWYQSEITDLPSGTYEVFGRHPEANCIFSLGTYQLGTQMSASDLTILTEDAQCGEEFGSIQIIPSSNEILFSINDGETWYQNIQHFAVSPGHYVVHIKSREGCTYDDQHVTVEWSEKLNPGQFLTINPSQCQLADGAIYPEISDAANSFSLDRGATWQLDGLFEGLGIGEYVVYFRKSDSTCLDSTRLTLRSEDIQVPFDTVELLHPSCSEAMDGYIHLELKEDTGQYEWQWSHGPNGNQVGRLTAGEYEVQVSAGPYCSFKKVISLFDPAPLSFDLPPLDGGFYCQGQPMAIRLQDSLLTYEWFHDNQLIETGPVLLANKAGSYKVIGTNLSGCIGTEEFSIKFSDEIFHANFLLSEMAVLGEPTSAVEISWPVPDEISWEVESGRIVDTILNRSVLIFDSIGEFTVRLKAIKNGCLSVQEKKISVVADADQLNFRVLDLSLKVSLFPNPNSGNFNVIVESSDLTDIQLRIYNEKSSLIYSDLVNDVKTYSKNIDLIGHSPGVYTLLVQSQTTWKAINFVLQ